MTPHPFIGEIRVFNARRVPNEWTICRGQLLSLMQFMPLFSMINTRYGGNGHVTFAIPNLERNKPGAALVFCLAVQGDFPDVRDNAPLEPAGLLGQIKLFHRDRIPSDFTACRGQVLPISEHQELFALIGACFGGDGQQTFALPNLDGNDPDAEVCYAIAVRGPAPNMEELLAEW